MSNGLHGEYKNGGWALVDAKGQPLTEYKYNFVTECGGGYFRAELGARKNVLRPDGTEVLSEWFNDVFDVENGYFIIGVTKRKTKTTPTQYLRGVAHISGVILFPPIFNKVHWLTEKKDAFYAELNGKPYIITTDGTIFDPERSHLPKNVRLNEKEFFEKFLNWTLPGLQFFYRDTDAPVIVESTYHVGDIVRAGFFLDVTTKLYKPTTKTRFLIASAHAAMFCEIDEMVRDNPNVKKWNLCVLHFNSYFKVMDVFTYEGVTQVFLLHIPKSAAIVLGSNEAPINFIDEATGQEKTLIETARQSLKEKMKMEVHPRSLDKDWIERTAHPVGLDEEFYPLPLSPAEEPETGEIASLSSLVHKMANDEDIQGVFELEDNFPWGGIKGYVCDGCIYANGIQGKGEGCGRLFKKSVRERYIKGICEYRKGSLYEESAFERNKRREHEKAIDKQEKQSDVFALRLLSEFIAEKLDGNIENLVDYDFGQLREDRKYGDCKGYAFSIDKTIIVKSIMALVFADAWKGLSVDAINNYVYDIDEIQKTLYLLGSDILGEYFMSLNKFHPSDELNHRCFDTARLTRTIGNYFVFPSKISFKAYRIDSKRRGYMDKFLDALYKCMTQQKKVDADIKGLLFKNRKLMTDYQGENAFSLLTDNLLLSDFVDENGQPRSIFKGVYGSQKILDKETYFAAIDEFCSFTEDFVPKRSRLIVDKLKQILK
jgi:hypothetical protein